MSAIRHKALMMVILGSLPAANCAQAADTAAVAHLLDDHFSSYTAKNQPGVAVMLVDDGDIVLQKTYGLANLDDKVPISADTAFRLGSVSKQFAAMAIMILEVEGKLSFDDPISNYVPELSPYGDTTIRHILQHTGGLPDYYDIIDTSSGMPTNADAAAIIGKMASPVFTAGDRYEYSNAGYDMLGPIVEAASGIPFVRFVQERIFDRAGMNSSAVHDHSLPTIRNRAYGYEPVPGGFVPDDADPLNGIVGSGGIYSTLNDMYLWDQALYGDLLVNQETLAIAFSPGETNDGKTIDYGFGWRIDSFEGHKRVRHGGSWVGFRAHIARIPDLRFTIVILSNRGDMDAGSYIDEVTEAYLGSAN